jgi:hypothetical protein
MRTVRVDSRSAIALRPAAPVQFRYPPQPNRVALTQFGGADRLDRLDLDSAFVRR